MSTDFGKYPSLAAAAEMPEKAFSELGTMTAAEWPDVLDSRETFWIFELDDYGNVVYTKAAYPADGAINTIVGQNFFDDMEGIENISECRHRFRSFVKSRKAAESFIWRCSSSGRAMNTKVSMTKAFETGSYPPSNVVMMEIRQV